ncbi:MAG: universal stress protein [Crocinitomicaceae bacterium]|nr:universal stress protein [Crocinitomicaceae bacterium]
MHKIIVPTDFTSTSMVAARYAAKLAANGLGDLHLVHIVARGSDLEISQNKINEQCRQLTDTGVPVTGVIRAGNFLHDIPEVAKEVEAGLIVMGTHGLKGFQYLAGSFALRMVTESITPYIIVQEGTTRSADIKRILVPIDLHKETKQKLTYCGKLAQKFDAEVHLIFPKESDEFFKKKLERNVAYSERYFENLGLKHQSVMADSSSSGFIKEIVLYAEKRDIDLICVLNLAGDNLLHAFGKDDEQKIITNDAQIPVLILNPVATLVDDKSIFAQ